MKHSEEEHAKQANSSNIDLRIIHAIVTILIVVVMFVAVTVVVVVVVVVAVTVMVIVLAVVGKHEDPSYRIRNNAHDKIYECNMANKNSKQHTNMGSITPPKARTILAQQQPPQ